MKDPLPTTIPEHDRDDVREMADIVRELKRSQDPDARETLLVQLAEHWLRNHDFSDKGLCEHYHSAFSALYLLQQKYKMAALHVGRMVLDLIPGYSEDDDDRPRFN